jgi:hypothetical protein
MGRTLRSHGPAEHQQLEHHGRRYHRTGGKSPAVEAMIRSSLQAARRTHGLKGLPSSISGKKPRSSASNGRANVIDYNDIPAGNHIPAGRKLGDYHAIKITLSPGLKRKLKKFQTIRLHKDSLDAARRGLGQDLLYVTKTQRDQINRRKKRGIQFSLSPHQLHFNRMHGSGLFSSFKDLVRSGYNKLKDSGLAEKAASAAGNLALQQGKKFALHKLDGRQGAAAGAARKLLGGGLLQDRAAMERLNRLGISPDVTNKLIAIKNGNLKGGGLLDIFGGLF